MRGPGEGSWRFWVMQNEELTGEGEGSKVKLSPEGPSRSRAADILIPHLLQDELVA